VELNWADIWIDLTNMTSLFKSHGRGEIVQTDEWNMTSLSGVYAGDISRTGHSIPFATADGAIAGVGAHQSLIDDED
jgi:thioredoxin reductase